jgi:hypothetical protein
LSEFTAASRSTDSGGLGVKRWPTRATRASNGGLRVGSRVGRSPGSLRFLASGVVEAGARHQGWWSRPRQPLRASGAVARSVERGGVRLTTTAAMGRQWQCSLGAVDDGGGSAATLGVVEGGGRLGWWTAVAQGSG